MFVESTLLLQHEPKALQSFLILTIGTEVQVCTTRDVCQLDNSWIIWGELIQTGSFNNCFPGVQTCSWFFFWIFLCGIFHIKSNIEFGCCLAPLEKKNPFCFYLKLCSEIYQHLFSLEPLELRQQRKET